MGSESNFQDVVLRVPKLDVLTQMDLSNALFGAGMTNAFDPFIANFTGITDDIGISASNIFQQNYLKWDLDGASAGGDMISSLKLSARNGVTDEQIDTTPQFNVDRPFVLIISDFVVRVCPTFCCSCATEVFLEKACKGPRRMDQGIHEMRRGSKESHFRI